ncbi:lysophospholipid acyltransferase family protein [soil metagenome]
MGQRTYSFGRFIGRVIAFQTMKITVLHAERFDQPGGFVVACTHLSHLEPAILSGLMRRRIDWMARLEFYQYGVARLLLNALGAFPVNRFGVPVKAIRTAITRAKAGTAVGIFPEGGVVHGAESVMLGGKIKLGACVVSIRAGVPIVPVAVLGTRQLVRIGPWVPPRRAKLWLIIGQPILPPVDYASRRAARLEFGERLAKEFQSLYHELRDTCNVPAEHCP